VYVCSTKGHYPHRFSVCFSYYGLSLGANSLSDNLYVSCALMGLVELPGQLVCIIAVDRLVLRVNTAQCICMGKMWKAL